MSLHDNLKDDGSTDCSSGEEEDTTTTICLMEVEEQEDGKKEEDLRRDPISVLGDDIGFYVLGKLEPRHLLKATLVSRQWYALSAPNSPLWQQACEKLWSKPSKVYNPAGSEHCRLSWKERYLYSDADRKRIKMNFSELTSFEWKFRFKRTAGVWWTEVDPYWVHGQDESMMMRRRFSMDGTFQAIGNSDPLMAPEDTMSWRFVGDKGAIQVEDFTPLKCSRLSDWGFCLENQWVILIADLSPGGPHNFGIRPKF